MSPTITNEAELAALPLRAVAVTEEGLSVVRTPSGVELFTADYAAHQPRPASGKYLLPNWQRFPLAVVGT